MEINDSINVREQRNKNNNCSCEIFLSILSLIIGVILTIGVFYLQSVDGERTEEIIILQKKALEELVKITQKQSDNINELKTITQNLLESNLKLSEMINSSDHQLKEINELNDKILSTNLILTNVTLNTFNLQKTQNDNLNISVHQLQQLQNITSSNNQQIKIQNENLSQLNNLNKLSLFSNNNLVNLTATSTKQTSIFQIGQSDLSINSFQISRFNQLMNMFKSDLTYSFFYTNSKTMCSTGFEYYDENTGSLKVLRILTTEKEIVSGVTYKGNLTIQCINSIDNTKDIININFIRVFSRWWNSTNVSPVYLGAKVSEDKLFIYKSGVYRDVVQNKGNNNECNSIYVNMTVLDGNSIIQCINLI